MKKGFLEMVSSSTTGSSADFSDLVDAEDNDDLRLAVSSVMGQRNTTIPIPKRTRTSNDGSTGMNEYQLISCAELEEVLQKLHLACTEGGFLILKNYGLRLTEFAAATAAGKCFLFCFRNHPQWQFPIINIFFIPSSSL